MTSAAVAVTGLNLLFFSKQNNKTILQARSVQVCVSFKTQKKKYSLKLNEFKKWFFLWL